MQKRTFAPTSLADKIVVSAATLAALALLGVVLAHWTWAWYAPRSEPGAHRVDKAPRIEEAYGLFGSAQRAASGGATGLALTLLGVAAASHGRPGHTIVQLDGRKTIVVREGEEVAPGIRLAEVHGDHIVVERQGVRETLTWPKQNRARHAPARQGPP